MACWSVMRSPRIDGAGFHEAQRISPGVLGIERPLAPGPDRDLAARLPVHLLAREPAERVGAPVGALEILDQEVERLGGGVRPVRLDDLQGHAAGVEVAARPGLQAALEAEEPAPALRRLGDV